MDFMESYYPMMNPSSPLHTTMLPFHIGLEVYKLNLSLQKDLHFA
jgi:hypothetical protein